LKLGDPRVMALWVALSLFTHLIQGFRNRDLRRHIGDLLGADPGSYSAAKMTYDLRRLRLKGLIYRPPRAHRYFLTTARLESGPADDSTGSTRLPSRDGRLSGPSCGTAAQIVGGPAAS
jgi:hypothetical protein